VEFWDRQGVAKALALNGQLLMKYPITVQAVQSGLGKATVASSVDAMKLYVSSLHFNVTEADLRPIFEAFGAVESIEVQRDPVTGISKGVGFINYKTAADAKTALGALHGLEIAGRAIKVAMASEATGGAKGYSGAGHERDGVDRLEIDDDGGGGLRMTGESRAQLMQKLAGSRGLLPDAKASGVISSKESLALPRMQTSTCVVIKNMFDPKTESEPDWDLDIKEDVYEEASKSGRLKHIYVDKNTQGHVYMRFESVAGAEGAIRAFNGRWFASRQILAEHMPEATYSLKFPESSR